MLENFIGSLENTLFQWHALELAIAFAAFVFFGITRREELRIAQDRLSSERAMNDARINAAKASEKFERERLEIERQGLEIERQRSALNIETLSAAHNLGSVLSRGIAHELRLHCDWAVDALSRAGLDPNGRSIINERSSHYHDEKIFLAESFAPLLLSRCTQYINEDGTKVRLFIDSGTTMIPLLEQIARISVRASKDVWTKNNSLELYTNNLSGVLAFMEHGREIYEDRHSDIVLPMKVLPGTPLATFAAVTGPETVNAINNMKTKIINGASGERCKIIAIVTGNWIRLRNQPPRIPIPLARGSGHREIKQAIVDIADEIFVIAPLGKIAVGITEKGFNDLLGFTPNASNRAKQGYLDLEIDIPGRAHQINPRIVKLITTSRSNSNFVLYNHFEHLQKHLDEPFNDGDDTNIIGVRKTMESTEFTTTEITKLPHIAFPFGKLDSEWQVQLLTEMPHQHTRTDTIKKKLFHIDK